MKGVIRDMPWGIGYSSEKFGLVSLNESYGGQYVTNGKELKTVNVLQERRCFKTVRRLFYFRQKGA